MDNATSFWMLNILKFQTDDNFVSYNGIVIVNEDNNKSLKRVNGAKTDIFFSKSFLHEKMKGKKIERSEK